MSGTDRSSWKEVCALLLLPALVQSPALLGLLNTDPFSMLAELLASSRPPLLPGLPWIDPNVGWITQPLGRFAADQWLAGRIPWWNPFNGLGMPLAAAMQPSALFLPFVLTLHFLKGYLWLRIELQAVAGLATFALLRCLGLSRTTALMGGALFQLNGSLAWFAHAPYMPIPFLPLLLLGVELTRANAARGERPARGSFWIAVAIAFSLYAGFPETAYLDGLLAAAWVPVRLAGLGWPARRRFLTAALAGVLTGLLLSAPIVWPFIEFLGRSEVGLHSGASGAIPLPGPAFPMLVLPYIFGPIAAFSGNDPSGQLGPSWQGLGGFLGFLPTVLASLGLGVIVFGRRSFVGIRLLCGVWIVVCLLKMAQVPGIAAVVELVPGVPQIAFARYIMPTLSMTCVILAAFAVEDVHTASPKRFAIIVAGVGALALIGIAVNTSAIRHAIGTAVTPFAAASLLGAATALAALALVLAFSPANWRRQATVALVVIEASLLFGLPMFSGPRAVVPDPAPIRFLTANLGLQRFYTLGPLQPNFSAMEGLASINYDMVPVDLSWIDYVRRHLDRYFNWVLFTGENWRFDPSLPGPASELITNLDAYRAVGVRYVLTPPTGDPLVMRDPRARAIAEAPPNVAARLTEGESLHGAFRGLPTQGGMIDRVELRLGTYRGLSNGLVEVTLCAGGDGAPCATGRIPARQAGDNQPWIVVLDAPLAVGPNATLAYTIRYSGGSVPVAVWLGRALETSSSVLGPQALPHDAAPDLAAIYRNPAAGPAYPTLVQQSPAAHIYELPDPAPYFQAGGACRLRIVDRESVTADCDAPDRLTRRELLDPGWRAAVGGSDVAIARAEEIFQSIPLPAGHSDVRFSYSPPGIAWAWLAFATGGLGLVWFWFGAALWFRSAVR